MSVFAKRKGLPVAVILALTGVLLFACAPQAEPTATPVAPATQAPGATAAAKPAATPEATVAKPKAGGTLTVRVDLDASSLDPGQGSSGGDHQFFFQIFDNLVTYDKQGVPSPKLSLAESWESSTDGKVITLRLRKGVKFHDGTDFNAEAVKWNLDRALDPKQSYVGAATIAAISSVDIVDNYTVKLTLSKAYAPLLVNLGDRPGCMWSPAGFKMAGAESGSKPVGSGPFKFVEWMPGSSATMKKNPDYWMKDEAGNQLPYVDKLVIRNIPESSVALAALKTGEVDVAVNLEAKEAPGVKADANLTLLLLPGAGVSGNYINTAIPPFDNVHLRKALAWAIDRQAYINAIHAGIGTEANQGAILPGQFAFDPTLKFYSYNPDKVKEELTLGGKPDGFTFAANGNSLSYQAKGAEWTKAELAKFGIIADLTIKDTGMSTTEMMTSGKVPILLAAGLSQRVDPDGMVSNLYHSKGYYNAGHSPFTDLDEAIEKAASTFDLAERKRLYRLVEQLGQEKYCIFTCFHYSTRTWGVQKWVRNIDTLAGCEQKLRAHWVWLNK